MLFYFLLVIVIVVFFNFATSSTIELKFEELGTSESTRTGLDRNQPISIEPYDGKFLLRSFGDEINGTYKQGEDDGITTTIIQAVEPVDYFGVYMEEVPLSSVKKKETSRRQL